MKIIEEGFGQNWSLQVRCEPIKDEQGLVYDSDKEHCGSLLEIDKDDVQLNHWVKFREDGYDYICICPKCKCKLLLNEKKLPEWVKKKARISFENKKATD